MIIHTARLTITDLREDMAEDIHRNSLDEDTRRFVPDEVFETPEEARETVVFLMQAARGPEGPYVHPILLHDGTNIGYVQACMAEHGWEVGYHIAAGHTGRGYATEALAAFLPVITARLGVRSIDGVVLEENAASRRVLEKCGFEHAFRGESDYQGRPRAVRRYQWPQKGNI